VLAAPLQPAPAALVGAGRGRSEVGAGTFRGRGGGGVGLSGSLVRSAVRTMKLDRAVPLLNHPNPTPPLKNRSGKYLDHPPEGVAPAGPTSRFSLFPDRWALGTGELLGAL